MAEEVGGSWEYTAAYRLVELYIKELIERKEKHSLDLEGIVEAYLYVLGRLKAGEEEVEQIARMIKEQQVKGGREGEPKLSSGLKQALSSLREEGSR